MQVFDQVLPSPTQSLNQRLCLCSTEGIIEKKERLQKETSEPKRVKDIENRGSERTEEIQHNKRIETVLSSEILRP